VCTTCRQGLRGPALRARPKTRPAPRGGRLRKFHAVVRFPFFFAEKLTPASPLSQTLLLWGVYSGTYIAANTIATACDDAEATPAQRHVSKLAGVSGVNLFLNVSKDRIFARMFGTGPPRRVPLPTVRSAAQQRRVASAARRVAVHRSPRAAGQHAGSLLSLSPPAPTTTFRPPPALTPAPLRRSTPCSACATR